MLNVKKLLYSALLLLPMAAKAQYYVLPTNWCEQGGTNASVQGISSVNFQQGIVPYCQVTVYLTGTQNLATIYSTSTGGTQPNPFNASSAGQFTVFAASGVGYDVVLSNGSQTICPACFANPVTITDVFTSGGSTGVSSVTGTAPIVATPSGSAVNVSCPTCSAGGAAGEPQQSTQFNNAGVITAIAITSSGVYSSCPTAFTFTGGGSGASATPSCTSSEGNYYVTGYNLLTGGLGYSGTVTVGVTGASGSGFAGTGVLGSGLGGAKQAVDAVGNVEGQFASDQWQTTSTSNNGIAMSRTQCISLPYACQILAPALYAETEAQPWNGSYQANGSLPGQVLVSEGPAYGQPVGCIDDMRFGAPQWICNGAELPPSWAPHGSTSTSILGTTITQHNTQYINSSDWEVAPALTLNAYSFAGTLWDSYQAQFPALNISQVNDSPAATYGVNISQMANAVGDSIPIEILHYERGGLSTGDSEGAENRITMAEALDVYAGTANTITNQSGTSNACYGPCTIFSTTQTLGYTGSLGDDLALIDLTQADTSGYVSLVSGRAVTCTGCDWDSTYGDSQAYTTLTATTAALSSVNPLQPNTNVTIDVTSSSGFTTPGNACLTDASGTHWELEPITAVGTGTLTLSVLRHKFASGSYVAEGGMACMGIEFTADEVGPGESVASVTVGSNGTGMTTGTYPLSFSGGGNNCQGEQGNLIVTSSTAAYAVMTHYGIGCSTAPTVTASPGGTPPTLTAVLGTTKSYSEQYFGAGTPLNVIRTVWPIAYNVSGNTLYGINSNESHYLGTVNSLVYPQMGSGGTASCTLSGGSLSTCTVSGGTGYSGTTTSSGFLLSPPQVQITGLTCTTYPVVYPSAVSGGALTALTIATAGTGCTGTPIVTIVPMNNYAVYPMARTLNVWNPSTGNVDGSSIATGLLAGTFNAGDTVEQEHYYVEQYHLVNGFIGGWQGGSYSDPIYIQTGGQSFDGRKDISYSTVTNDNAPNLYYGYPGNEPWIIASQQMYAPTAYELDGPFGNGLYLNEPTFGTGSHTQGGALAIGCNISGTDICASWNQYSIVINHANQQTNGTGQDVLEYNPYSYEWQWTSGASGGAGGSASWYVQFSTTGLTQGSGTSAAAQFPVRDTSGTSTYAVGSGTAQVQTASPSRTSGALSAGMVARWLPVAANTGSGATLAWSGLAAKTITKCGTSALAANDLNTTIIATAIYDGTDWELQNPQAVGCGAAPSLGSNGTVGYVWTQTGPTTQAWASQLSGPTVAYWTNPGNNNLTGSLATTTNFLTCSGITITASVGSFDHLTMYLGTADSNSSDLYSFALYPYASSGTVTAACTTTPQAMNVATGAVTLPCSQTAVTLPAGNYYACWTGNANVAAFGAVSNSATWFHEAVTSIASSGGTSPSSIAVPGVSIAIQTGQPTLVLGP